MFHYAIFYTLSVAIVKQDGENKLNRLHLNVAMSVKFNTIYDVKHTTALRFSQARFNRQVNRRMMYLKLV
jgi:hypothetical protein